MTTFNVVTIYSSVANIIFSCIVVYYDNHEHACKNDGDRLGVYKVEGYAGAEDEIVGALDVTVLEEMFAVVIADGILKPVKFAVVERRGVSDDPHSHRLRARRLPVRPRRRILT